MKATACGKHRAKRFKKIVYIIYASRTSRKRPEDIGGKVDSAGGKKIDDKVHQDNKTKESRVEDKGIACGLQEKTAVEENNSLPADE